MFWGVPVRYAEGALDFGTGGTLCPIWGEQYCKWQVIVKGPDFALGLWCLKLQRGAYPLIGANRHEWSSRCCTNHYYHHCHFLVYYGGLRVPNTGSISILYPPLHRTFCRLFHVLTSYPSFSCVWPFNQVFFPNYFLFFYMRPAIEQLYCCILCFNIPPCSWDIGLCNFLICCQFILYSISQHFFLWRKMSPIHLKWWKDFPFTQ